MAPTNSDSKVVCRYFLEAVERVKGTEFHTNVWITLYIIHAGCPTVVRCDYGTENSNLATCQIAFRINHNDSMADKCFMYGPSKSNIVSCVYIIKHYFTVNMPRY